MRILLTGRNGQVGWELERALPALGEVIATDRSTLDLSRPDSIRSVVREVRPAVIVNAAAYTAVDKAESEPELAMAINGAGPGILAEEAKRLGALLVHYSTDYVFDGTKDGPYTEDDAPNPLNVYGRTKLEGERRIAASGCEYLVLRTSWVYGPRARNFYRTILEKAAAGELLRMVDDQRSVPTPSRFLAEQTVACLRRGARGLLNLVPSGSATRYGFARAAAEGARIEPVASSEFPAAAARPASSVLSNARAQALLGARLPDWRELLAEVRASG